MKRFALLVVVFAVSCGIAGVAVAADGPMADAGLDQTVTVDTTVQLDATGSAYPSGDIASYRWEVTTPDNRRTTPDCADCSRTSFVPTTPGRYEVALTVVGEDGTQSSDTLYVYVNDAGPSVSLSGATTPETATPTEYVATAESPDAELSEIAWAVDDEIVGTRSLEGTAATDDLRIAFPGEGPYRVQVVVVDTNGRTAYDDIVVRPGGTDTSETDWDDIDPTPSSPDCSDSEYLASNPDDCLSAERAPSGGAPTPTPPTEGDTPESTPQPPKDEEVFYDTDGYSSTLGVGSRITDSSYLGSTADAVGLDGGENAPWKEGFGERVYEDTVGAASTFLFGQEEETVTCETTGGEWNACDEKIRELEQEGGTTNAYSPSEGGVYHQYGLENAERIAGPNPTSLEDGQDATVTVVVQEDKDNILEKGMDAAESISDVGRSYVSDDESDGDEGDGWSEPTTPIATDGDPSGDGSSESESAASELQSRLPEMELGGGGGDTDESTDGGSDGSGSTRPNDVGGSGGLDGGLVA